MSFKTWLESVSHLDNVLLESLITEQPHTAFIGHVPDILSFLNGRMVDLGFENLGLPKYQRDKILNAFADKGVMVPGTPYKLRDIGPLRAAVEFVQGDEKVTLPDYWKAGVLVLGDDMTPTWIGHGVRPDQIKGFDLTNDHDVGEGMMVVSNIKTSVGN